MTCRIIQGHREPRDSIEDIRFTSLPIYQCNFTFISHHFSKYRDLLVQNSTSSMPSCI